VERLYYVSRGRFSTKKSIKKGGQLTSLSSGNRRLAVRLAPASFEFNPGTLKIKKGGQLTSLSSGNRRLAIRLAPASFEFNPETLKIKKEGQLTSLSSGNRTRTCDLRVMSPTSCQLLHPAILDCKGKTIFFNIKYICENIKNKLVYRWPNHQLEFLIIRLSFWF
jgi:virulence-associated protein VagC